MAKKLKSGAKWVCNSLLSRPSDQACIFCVAPQGANASGPGLDDRRAAMLAEFLDKELAGLLINLWLCGVVCCDGSSFHLQPQS